MSLVTINYSEMTQAIMSFVSSRPNWYLDFKDRYYSFCEDGEIRLHNYNTRCNTLATKKTTVDGNLVNENASPSFIRFIVNGDYGETKTFDNVEYTGEFATGKNFTSVLFKTLTQDSSAVSPSNIARKEDTYSFAIPRRNYGTSFQERMRGRYIISDYEINDIAGDKFSIPYIKTTYRYSKI